MKKIKRSKIGIALILIAAMILTGCGGGDSTSNGEATVNGNRANTSSDGNNDGQNQTPGEYGVLVLNQKGEVLSGASVTFNGESKETSGQGYAMFTRPASSTVSLVVSCQGYYSVENNAFKIPSNKTQSRVVLKSSSISKHRLASATYANGDKSKDLLNDCARIYQSTQGMDFSISTSVIGDADQVSKYELHQQVEGVDSVIATSANGTFEHLNETMFKAGTGVYVKVYDKGSHMTATALNFEVGAAPKLLTNTSISLADGIEFEVSDRVPIFGGTKLSMDVPALPITEKVGINEEGEPSVQVGFNISEDTINNVTEMDEYKKCMDSMRHAKKEATQYKKLVRQMKRHQSRSGIMSMSKFEKGIDFSASGYVEAGFDSEGNVSKGTGYLCISAEGSAEFDWQFVVWVIPVTVNVKGEVTADLAGTISYSFADNKFEGADVALTIKPGLTVSAGPGFKYLSAGVYGSAALETKLVIASFTENSGFDYVNLESSVGIYGKFGPFKAEKDMWDSGTIPLYQRSDEKKYKTKSKTKKDKKTTENVTQRLYDISNYKPTAEADDELTATSLESDNDLDRITLAADINEGAKPVMEANDTTALAMFASQKELGDATYTYSKLYYSIYEDGQWQDSVALSDNVCNEMNPVMYRNGNDIYIAYQETDYDYTQFDNYEDKTSEEQKEQMKAFWKSVDLHVQKFNLATKTFSDMGTIRTAGCYDYNASLCMTDGTLKVYWVENNDGDVFGLDKEVDNDICYTVYTGGSWDGVQTIQNDVKNVTNLEAGLYDGEEVCVYTTDKDEDMSTWQDITTYLYRKGNVKEIRKGKVTQLQYSKLPGTQKAQFLVSDSGNLYAYSEGEWKAVLENTGSYNDEFSITDNAVYFEKQAESGSELYGCYDMGEDALAAPIQISEEGRWLRDVSVFTINGKEVMLGMEDVIEDNEKTQSNMVSYRFGKYYDLTLKEAYIDYEDTFKLGSMPLYVVAENTGNITIPAEEFVVKDGNDNVLKIQTKEYSKPIAPGESVTFDLSVLTDADTSFENWKIESNALKAPVRSAGSKTSAIEEGDATETDDETEKEVLEEHSTEDNAYTIKTGYSDFEVSSSLNNAGAYPYLMVEVKNNGTISDFSKLKICDANDMTKEFTSSDTGTIDVGSTKIFKIKVEKDWADANGRTAMLIKVDETENEIYTYNNFSYEYSTLNYGQYAITYVLNGGTNNSKNPYTYLTTDTISLAKPTRSDYTFVGWYTSPGFEESTQLVQIDAGTAGNITLYAKWNAKNTSKKTTYPPKVKKSTSTSKPGKVRITYAKNKKKRKIALSWKKVKNAKGYKVQYSMNKKFAKKSVKTKFCKKNKCTLQKLKKSKTYYVRIRAYKLKGKKKVYGSWSRVKKVKIKR